MTQLRLLAAAAVLGGVLVYSGGASANVCEADTTWKPGLDNDVDNCKELWKGVGVPVYAGESIDATPVCHTKYVLSHNNVNKTPDWVIEHLTRKQVSGKNKRPNVKFGYEDKICAPAQAKDARYVSSGFDRGHQAPSADFSENRDWMKESFKLSNAVPQIGIGFNRHIWKEFEDLVRKLTVNRGELYVITGPINTDARGRIDSITRAVNPCHNVIKLEPPKPSEICGGDTKSKKACENGVKVPAALYKIIYDPGMKRANAYVLPNINHNKLDNTSDALDYLKQYRTSIRVIERLTGLQFLRDIPRRKRKAQIEQCIATMLH